MAVQSEKISESGECDGLNCLAASKASSGDLAAILFGVGMPYYTNPRDGQFWLVVPETPLAMYRVEEVHGLVFMNGQESLLAGRSNLKTTRQQIVRRARILSDPGKGGSFPQGGEHCGLEGCGRDRMEDGKARGSDNSIQNNFRPTMTMDSARREFFSFEGCHKSLDLLGFVGLEEHRHILTLSSSRSCIRYSGPSEI